MHDALITWYHTHARDLPWRSTDCTPWGVLVSEIMLQQTPVPRVEPVWHEWMRRWPAPADLAAEEPGEAIRAWGRLGYPRRALRLHAAAQAIVSRHDGTVPQSYDELLALPGVGDYTAAAVASFAFGARHAVLDTNVRRVLARAFSGTRYPANSTTAAERRLAEELLPTDDTAPVWSVALMELGALVCTARAPRCGACPIAAECTWRLSGFPDHDGPAPRGQAWAGTDRQVRGRLMAVLRDSTGPVPKPVLDAVWPDAVQRERALDGLVADGLVEPLDEELYRLPTSPSS
ncbi:A/G-specific adenine glycosylase [Actinobacteria bacterium YIM 96077]|uniref:Adenine DNA glycosylase n=1 Tax=Phytoactinopolyspora halophila TaxID=1981511 RepID=A0A329QTS6_9ACTN|nr:A/G-specific adenine glycosylase [Phytoactinopolyspora halophila]AYY14502.1 A/G-specific adenine glycosylase [Actinobacteria bacterium YIM 96077]RAW14118.1 A/G-specific adenine glycosylase [Phytoactinopolyspora halophila]